jgi:hypothetical protein
VKAGTYRIVIRDRSAIHNFHLIGPRRLALVPVEACRLACLMKCTERVPARLWPATRRGEDECVRVYTIRSARHQPLSVFLPE